MNPVEPRVEIEVLVLEAVLHRITRRELMLMLCADDHVPLRVASVHTWCLSHQLIIIIDAKLSVGTCKGHAGVQRATILKANSMVEAYSAVALARPRII